MRHNHFTMFLLFSLSAVGLTHAAQAQGNRCADCHSANGVETYHLLDWQLSTHAKSGVGCEDCHGGDASTFESLQAHQDVANSNQPESPTHFKNLAQTCGNCHASIVKAFEETRHGELVRAGNYDAPTCSTCHTSVGAFLLSSRGLERHCNQCHGEKAKAPRPDRAEFSADLHKRFRELDKVLEGLERLVDKTSDANQRSQRLGAIRNIQWHRSQAAVKAHALDSTGVLDQLVKSEKAAQALTDKIANQPPKSKDP